MDPFAGLHVMSWQLCWWSRIILSLSRELDFILMQILRKKNCIVLTTNKAALSRG